MKELGNITEEDKARIEALGVLKEKRAAEETLDMLARIWEFSGLLVDERR